MNHTATLASSIAPEPPSFLNGDAIVGLLAFALGVMLLVGALIAARNANKGDVKGNAKIGLAHLIAVLLFVAGAGGIAFALVEGSLGQYFNTPSAASSSDAS